MNYPIFILFSDGDVMVLRKKIDLCFFGQRGSLFIAVFPFCCNKIYT